MQLEKMKWLGAMLLDTLLAIVKAANQGKSLIFVCPQNWKSGKMWMLASAVDCHCIPT